MRGAIVIFSFIMIVISCKEKSSQQLTETQPANDSLKKMTIDALSGTWQQYKRTSSVNMNDTLPDTAALIRISNDSFYFIRNDSIKYVDVLQLHEKRKYYNEYGFKQNTVDKLRASPENDSGIVLYRYAFEGDVEFYKKIDE